MSYVASAPYYTRSAMPSYIQVAASTRGLGKFLRYVRTLIFRGESPSRHSSEAEVPVNWHESFIEHLASVLKPKVYVELGLYRCALFNRIIPHADHLIGVDLDAEVKNWIAKCDKVEFVHSGTDDYAIALRQRPIAIDMLFIDADHSSGQVLKDFWNFFPFVSWHGLILLHDTHPKSMEFTQAGHCLDAYKAVEELSRHTEEFEIMTIPVHPGLTLCRKRIRQLSWMER